MKKAIKFDLVDADYSLMHLSALSALTNSALSKKPVDDLEAFEGITEIDGVVVDDDFRRQILRSSNRELLVLDRLHQLTVAAMAFAVFEFALTATRENCVNVLGVEDDTNKNKSKLELAKKVLSRVEGVAPLFSSSEWEFLTRVAKIRHLTLHNGGMIETSSEARDLLLEIQGLSLMPFSDGAHYEIISLAPWVSRKIIKDIRGFLEKLNGALNAAD